MLQVLGETELFKVHPLKTGCATSYLQCSDFLVNGCGRHASEQSDKLTIVARAVPSLEKLSETVAAALTYT